jgi:hypothetical protein
MYLTLRAVKPAETVRVLRVAGWANAEASVARRYLFAAVPFAIGRIMRANIHQVVKVGFDLD